MSKAMTVRDTVTELAWLRERIARLGKAQEKLQMAMDDYHQTVVYEYGALTLSGYEELREAMNEVIEV